MASLVKYTLLALVAFAAGWNSRAYLTHPKPVAPSTTTRVVVEKDNYIPVFVENTESTAAPADRPLGEVLEDQADASAPSPDDSTEQFRQLLNSNHFQRAVNFYAAKESIVSERVLETWRGLIHHSLELKLSNAELQLFSELAETWLNYRYNDIDTILLQAQYYWAMGYISDTLQSFIQADSYAVSTAEHSQVREQLYKFIVRYDADLAAAEAWYELTNFYAQLDSLGIAKAGDKYRYAELLLTQGDDKLAFRYLDEIINDPAWRSKALALKKLWSDKGNYSPSSSPGFASNIPLKPIGHHYLVELALDGGDPMHLLLDTGASITMINTQAFGRQRLSGDWLDKGWRYFSTANGVIQGRLMEVATASFGEYELSQLSIAVQDVHLGDGIDGLLGMNVLSRFHFQIDQDSHTLMLTPRQ